MQTLASEHAARRARLGCPSARFPIVSPFLAKVRESPSLHIYTSPIGPPDLKGIATRAGLISVLPGAVGAAFGDEPETHYLSAEILAAVCQARKIDKTDLLSPRRLQKTVNIRQEAYWLVKKLTKLSLPQMGRIFERDHATILHGVRKHQAKIDAGLVDTLGEIKPFIDAARAAKAAEARP